MTFNFKTFGIIFAFTLKGGNMKRTVFIILLCVGVFSLRGELLISVMGGVYTNPARIDVYDIPLTTTHFHDNLTIYEYNHGGFDTSAGIGFQLGVATFLTYKLGAAISVGYFKTNVEINNHYNIAFTWWDNTSGEDHKNWTSDGRVTIIPFSFDLVYRLVNKENLKVSLYVGPTLFRTNIDLEGHHGYATTLDTGEEWLVDWFDLPIENSLKKSILGGNIGFDVEYLISDMMSVFLGGYLYFAEKVQTSWQVEPNIYRGEFANIDLTIPENSTLLSLRSRINFTTFFIGAGLRIYL